MPRPMGRYFASVIAKIQSFKDQESIIIDQPFKSRLRQDLLEKISTSGFESESIPFYKNILKWKFQLSLVPIFGLLIVGFFALRNLPAVLDPAKLVQVAMAPQNAQPQGQLQKNVQTQNDLILREAFITFLQKPLENSTELLSPYVKKLENLKANDLIALVEPLDAQANSLETPKDTLNLKMEPVLETVPPTIAVVSKPEIVAPVPVAIQQKAPTSLVPATNPMNDLSAIPTSVTQPFSLKNLKMSIAQAPATSVLMQPTTSTKKLFAKAVPQQFNISFSGNFSNDEKTVFSKSFIPNLVKGKKVTAVQVRQLNHGVVLIEVTLADKTVTSRQFHYMNGAWESIN